MHLWIRGGFREARIGAGSQRFAGASFHLPDEAGQECSDAAVREDDFYLIIFNGHYLACSVFWNAYIVALGKNGAFRDMVARRA